ncbi:helix-turn-helix domain-containing protein [Saccharopolyspora spinosa]|uniref:Transcriptional regulator with XRE-family HTH domain n=1 Tax=Saccharopolyspora spinosa TaxID=60894 RepID=A0A2N3Y5J5_SACSN|nr:helix-turn-helix transcriptional regulator [Saccharopolyspora spinosa]PKW18206.1 transcriptional regulator with XRE-family HTH domain [Saccharopolyspora spinosa]
MDPFDEEAHIGRRIREVRAFRGMTLKTTAELAGMTPGHLSNIERGRRRVDKRSTLEALAAALSVAPSELAATPFPPRDDAAAEARAAVGMIEAVVADLRLDDPVEVEPRAWTEIVADLKHLNSDLRPRADYAAQGLLVPGLIKELHAVYYTDQARRSDALVGLATCYHAASMLAKSMGVPGIAQLAADRSITIADRLGRPGWIAHAAWVRTQAIGGSGRKRQAALARRSIDAVDREPMTPELRQAVGQLHLNAALAYASMGQESDAWTHYREAEELAERQREDVGQFGYMWFGRANVRIWQVALATEFGYGGRVVEMAKGARPEVVPSPARQGEFYADLGRSLAVDKRTRSQAIQLLRKAENLAPQRVRNMPFVRETIADLVQRAQRDSVGRELRGMAYRMGITL